MALETDFAKEFENIRKRCIEFEEKSKKDEMRCLMLETEVLNLKKKNEELEGKITMIQKIIVDPTYVVNGNENLYNVMAENKVSGSRESGDEEQMDEFSIHSLNTRAAKRKRVAKIITSDDENSCDDNAPICTLITQHSSRLMTNSEEEIEENVSRRHLRRLRKLVSKNKQDKSSIDLVKTVGSTEDEEDSDEDDLESEGESLDGFIVHSSESVPKCDSESGDSADESEDASNMFTVTMEKTGRKKVTNFKWDLEGDMLSDFAKDPGLCMRAVCALYRQQTADEKASKETLHRNERGFSQIDASRASDLAEFLMDGDPNGDLNKTVEELKEYDPKGIKLCMALAAKYSKQLFTIYQNKEDPYFLPQ